MASDNRGNAGMDNTDPPSLRRRYAEEWEADRDKRMFDELHRLRRISEEIGTGNNGPVPDISFWNYVISGAYAMFLFTLVTMTSYALTRLFNEYFKGYFEE